MRTITSQVQILIDAALVSAKRQQVAAAIVVVDNDGRTLAAVRDETSGAINLEMAGKKAATAAQFRAPTQKILDQISADERIVDEVLANSDLLLLAGGLPWHMDGKMIGAIGVAGGHYTQDATIAIEALASWDRQSGPAIAPTDTQLSTSSTWDFRGKKVIVTGAMGGIGLHACEIFAQAGATVVGVDLQADVEGRKAEEYGERGLKISFVTLDVADPKAIADLGDTIASQLGHVDVLINNAGVLSFGPVLQTAVAEWDRVQNINCRSAFLMIRAIAPLMGGVGAIVNVSSSAALAPTANSAAYSVAKMGVVTLTKISALELGPNIRVNAICPGPLDTAMPRNYLRGHPKEQEIMDSMINRTIVKRLGQAAEIADLIVLLASERAAFIAGAVISADGGFLS